MLFLHLQVPLFQILPCLYEILPQTEIPFHLAHLWIMYLIDGIYVMLEREKQVADPFTFINQPCFCLYQMLFLNYGHKQVKLSILQKCISSYLLTFFSLVNRITGVYFRKIGKQKMTTIRRNKQKLHTVISQRTNKYILKKMPQIYLNFSPLLK